MKPKFERKPFKTNEEQTAQSVRMLLRYFDKDETILTLGRRIRELEAELSLLRKQQPITNPINPQP